MSFRQHTPIYFIGDVHSRPELVRAALEMADGNPIVFLGDIFDGPGGPDGSAECLRLIMNSPNAELILGNHEAYPVFSGYWDEGSNLARFWDLSPHSQEAIRIYHEWLEIKHRLYVRELEWLMSRPVYIQGDGWIAAHAKVPDGPLPPEIWSDYPDEQQTQIEMLDNTDPLYPGHFWAQDYDGRHGFAIVGHTRLPKVGEFAWGHCILLDWDAKNVGTAAYAIWFDGEVVEVGGLDPLGRTSNPRKPLMPEQRADRNEQERKRWASLTPEQKANATEKQRQRRASRTPEQREAFNERQRQSRASMTPEQREAIAERERRRYFSMTPEQKAARSEHKRQRYHSMTPEEKEAYKELQRQRYHSMTPEQKAAALERERRRYRSMTPEQRAAYYERKRKRRDKIRERLERARLGVLAYFTKKEIEQMRDEELARRESMTEEELSAERDAFRDRLDSIGFGAPDFDGLERLRADELRAMAAFIASQRGTRYEEIMEDEEEEEETALEEGLDDDSREPNPRVAAKRTDEALWKRIVKRITAGSKGGHPGQWSARKAQLAVAEYKAKGGEYIGKKSKDNSLHKWTIQDWRTKSGRASLETGERYLPAKAIEALSDEEYRETSRAKRAGLRKGKQFTPQPKKIANKVARYRKNNPEVRGADGFDIFEEAVYNKKQTSSHRGHMTSHSSRHANPIGRESVFLSELVRSLSRNEGQVPAEIIEELRSSLAGSSDDPRPEIDRVYMMASYIAAHIVPVAVSLEGESREMLKISERDEGLALDNVASLEGYTRSARGLRDYFLSREKEAGARGGVSHDPIVAAEAEARKKYPDYSTDSPGVRAFKEKKRREVVEIALKANKEKADKIVKRLTISVLDLAISYCTAAEELSMEFESRNTLSKERTALASNLAAQLIVLILSAVQFSSPVGTAPVEQRLEEASQAIADLMATGMVREAAIRELRMRPAQYARGGVVGAKGELVTSLDRLARNMKIHHSRYAQGGHPRQPARVLETDELGGPEIVRRIRKRTPNPDTIDPAYSDYYSRRGY